VEIAGADVHGLKLWGPTPVHISGETVWDREAPGPADTKMFIHLQGTLRGSGFVPAEPGVPESFSMSGSFLHEDYVIDRVEVRHGVGAYVKDFTWEGKRPPANTIRLGGESGGGRVRVVLRGDGAFASVKVIDRAGRPTSNAFVAMIPTSSASQAEMSAAMKFGQTDQNGQLELDAVPPGSYHVLAIPGLSDSASSQMSRTFESPLSAHLVSMLWLAQRRGQMVDIAPRARIQLRLEPQTLR
jgi:hypothetical protein